MKGFTLLEVMISISIIALVLVSLFRMQSSTLTLATAVKFDSIVPILAKRLLGDIEQDLVNWYETEGDFGENYPGVGWTCRISEASFENLDFVSPKDQNRLKRIEIEIKDLLNQRVYKIVTWRRFSE